MAIRLRTGLLLLTLLVTSGCFSPTGYLFTYSTIPYALPYDHVISKASKKCVVDITQLKEPFSQANLSVVWTSRAAAEAAARAGLKDLRYADLQTLSIMNGTYLRRRLVFYGE